MNTERVSSCQLINKAFIIPLLPTMQCREREPVVLKLITKRLSVLQFFIFAVFIIHFNYIYEIVLIKRILSSKASLVNITIVLHDHQSQTTPLLGRTDSGIFRKPL